MHLAIAAYEHAARLIGLTPWEVSRHPVRLLEAHQAAYRQYRHDPVMVGMDVYNVEAEAYGTTLAEPAGNTVPVPARHLCATAADILKLPPFRPDRPRLSEIVDAARRLKDRHPEAHICVPLSGPFAIACALLGFEKTLSEAVENADALGEALLFLARNQAACARYAAERGLEPYIFESAAVPPLFSPALFAKQEKPALALILAEAAKVFGRPIGCFLDGDTLPVSDDLCACGPGIILCPRQTDQTRFIDAMKRYPDIRVRVDMDATVFSSANPAPALAEADRVARLAKPLGPRACLGTGILAFDAVPATVMAVRDHVAAL